MYSLKLNQMNTRITEGASAQPTKARRGFAAMDKDKQREIASKGGKASKGGGRKPYKSKPR